MPSRYLITLLVLALSAAPGADKKDKHSGKFGGLAITTTAIEVAQHRRPTGRHYVAVLVRIQNTGKNVACASLIPTLRTTFGLEYRRAMGFDTPHGLEEPRIHEMLPGEETSGAYVFDVKDGVEPLEMLLRLDGRSIRCGAAKGSWGDALLRNEIRLDVHDLRPPVTKKD